MRNKSSSVSVNILKMKFSGNKFINEFKEGCKMEDLKDSRIFENKESKSKYSNGLQKSRKKSNGYMRKRVTTGTL